MKRRKLLRNILLFIFAFILGYTVKNEGNNIVLEQVDSDIKNIKKKTKSVISVTEFGADPNGILDSTDSFKKARDYIASIKQSPKLVFPAGTYRYKISPNWAIQDAVIVNDGEVRLRYEGKGNAIVLDGGSDGTGVFNLTFGQFIIEASSTSSDAVYTRALHHGRVDVKILGCGTKSAGLLSEWCVATKFNVVVSGNQESIWYSNAKPKYGIRLTRRNIGEDTSYCLFLNPILEGVEVGALLDYSLGNNFIGGTMEACQNYGAYLTTNAYNNKFFNVDFEINGDADLNCEGHENFFYGCDSYTTTVFGSSSKNNSIIGGVYSSLLVVKGAQNNLISSIRYNRFNNNSNIMDNGEKTRYRDNFNMGLNMYDDEIRNRVEITGSSPLTYKNSSGNDETLILFGGTITELTYTHNGTKDIITGVTGFIRMAPNDSITVVYSTPPTMIKYA